MATRVELRKVRVEGENPAPFDEPIRLHIVLEIFEKVPQNAIDVSFTWSPVWDFPVDQELDEMEVGPFAALGKHEFVIESDPPDVTQIPDPTGPTALIVSLKYKEEEFLHIGYNVTVTCQGEMPDVFSSTEQLTRELGKCYPKVREIHWDAELPPAQVPPGEDAEKFDSDSGSQESDETDEASEKRARQEV